MRAGGATVRDGQRRSSADASFRENEIAGVCNYVLSSPHIRAAFLTFYRYHCFRPCARLRTFPHTLTLPAIGCLVRGPACLPGMSCNRSYPRAPVRSPWFLMMHGCLATCEFYSRVWHIRIRSMTLHRHTRVGFEVA